MVSKTHGFTLIELTIVFTVMVIAMGVMFPIGTHLKHRALRMKQQVQWLRYRQGLLSYKDHYGYFPAFLPVDQCVPWVDFHKRLIATLSGRDFQGESSKLYNPETVCFCEFDLEDENFFENSESDGPQLFLIIRKDLSPTEAHKRYHRYARDTNLDWTSHVILFTQTTKNIQNSSKRIAKIIAD